MPEPFSYRNFFQFIIGIISDFSLDPGYSLHIVIVENNQLTVLCLLDVKLNIVGIDINSRLKGIYGIFRCSIGKSSMCCYLSSDKNTCFQIYIATVSRLDIVEIKKDTKGENYCSQTDFDRSRDFFFVRLRQGNRRILGIVFKKFAGQSAD